MRTVLNQTTWVRVLCAVGMIALAGGCARYGGTVTLESREGGRVVEQRFPQAYITTARAGEYDILFVDAGADWQYKRPKKNRPLEPIPLAPLRQVMHVHLYWKPLAGTTKNPAAINAAIDWYVLGPDGSRDVLLYSGAGLVTVTGSGDKRTVTIRDGRLRPKVNAGDLHDPVGEARVSGRVVARPNDSRVTETLAEMRDTVRAATADAGR